MVSHNATIVTDLGFGDAGKGTITDFLARQGRVSAVVRFNGGGQAAHNVVTPDGRHHTFSQFGSGTFVPGVRTHLSHFMLIDPLGLVAEASELKKKGCGNVLERLTIDAYAVVVTPLHKEANVIRETLRGTHAHGTCGHGIGETMSLSILEPGLTVYARDLTDKRLLHQKLERIQQYFRAEFADYLSSAHHTVAGSIRSIAMPLEWATLFAQAGELLTIVDTSYLGTLAKAGNLLFEGAQGVLLDEWRGFHPHTTWSTTTAANARTLLREIEYEGEVQTLGVIRSYFVRHGNGPFPTEDPQLTSLLRDVHNSDTGAQGKFRCGWFDLVLMRYALECVGGVDALAVTYLDALPRLLKHQVCSGYRLPGLLHGALNRLVLNPVLTDLSYQEKLTELLVQVAPEYREEPLHDTEAFLAMLEAECRTPVVITSSGPASTDKLFRNRVLAV